MKKKLVVFTGAGISAESGIKTFRDSGGLWEDYDIMDVATPEAWARQPKIVLEFYNARRKQIIAANPNVAHRSIAFLEKHFDVDVITQNIDDLHERAGSKKVLHLHGQIMKSRSSIKRNLLYDIKGDTIEWGEQCEYGSQLRPDVVWFGEQVPSMSKAEELTAKADVFIVVGTSLNVYPAAGLIYVAPRHSLKYLIDPGDPIFPEHLNIEWIKRNASEGMELLIKSLLDKTE
jgi:NAD-dependent deacetylase